MELFFTRVSRLERTPGTPRGEHDLEFTAEQARGLGLRDGIPFILDSGGSYDIHLNRFLRDEAARGGLSPHTGRAYAYDILTWARYLAERRGPLSSNGQALGKTIWEADQSDIVAYHQERRVGSYSTGGGTVEISTWDRAVSALDRLYTWAKKEAIITKVPFTYSDEKGNHGSGDPWNSGSSNTALEAGARHNRVRWLSLPQYIFFREVGLRGRLPDGAEDPKSRVRTGARNAAFADLLVATGMRVREGGSLLDREVAAPGDTILLSEQRSVAMNLAPARCKGRKGRTVYAGLDLLVQVDNYRRVERALALEQRRKHDHEPVARRLLRVTCPRGGSFRLDDGTVLPFARMTDSDVFRSIECPEATTSSTPVQLFLTESGSPFPVEAWYDVFRKASDRCRTFGMDLHVTPHVLRHTFAIHYLTHKVRSLIGTIDSAEYRNDSARQAYLRILTDPLRQLQRRLGHAWIESTYHYLDHVADAQELIDDAFHRWRGVDEEESV